ncbi:MAG: pilin [Elusimicrobiaceae bacterium]|nr:pilin [Elusimicrobiaceae bacterium]
MKRGFTLIELLVVVLIIGVLTAIALPQYEKAVEKAKLTEALETLSALQRATDIFCLENGLPTTESRLLGGTDNPGQNLSINLTGLSCSDENFGGHKFCNSKYFGYEVICYNNGCVISAARTQNNTWLYFLYLDNRDENNNNYSKTCLIETDKGEGICNGLGKQGWNIDDDR